MDLEPVKVVRVITRLNIGGPAVHAILLSTKMDPARFSTCLVTGEPEATEGDLSQFAHGPQMRLMHLPSLARPIRPLADLRALMQLFRILSTERPQVLHTHMAKAGALGRLAGLLYNRVGPGRSPGRRAVVLHTFHGHVLEGYFAGWLSQVFVAVERWLARRTDVLVAVSGTIQDQLLNKGIGRRDQWRVVPLGLDLSAFAQLPFPDSSTPVRVGVVGRLVPIKNTRLFLQAFAGLARQPSGPSMRGVVVGDGPLRSTLEQEAKRLGVEPLVHFTGWQQDLCAVYEGLDVACLTSWNEGTPVSLIEAMAAGRAVVATDVGGVRELLADGGGSQAPIPRRGFQIAQRGILVSPGDVDGLVAALNQVGRDPLLRRRLGEAARAHVVEAYKAQRLLSDLAALYDELIGSTATRARRTR